MDLRVDQFVFDLETADVSAAPQFQSSNGDVFEVLIGELATTSSVQPEVEEQGDPCE